MNATAIEASKRPLDQNLEACADQVASDRPAGASGLAIQTCKELLRVAGDIYLAKDISGFGDAVLRALATIIPYDLGSFHVAEPELQRVDVTYQPERPAEVELGKSPWQLLQDHPLQRVLLFDPGRLWRRSDIPSELSSRANGLPLARSGCARFDYQLGAALVSQAKAGEYVLICLERAAMDFSAAEMTVVSLLLPHIVQAHQTLRGAANRTADAVPEEPLRFRQWIRERTQWKLTPREADVLCWLCQGKTNDEIGIILGIAERTAETHALHIYPKLGVGNRSAAIAAVNRLSFETEI